MSRREHMNLAPLSEAIQYSVDTERHIADLEAVLDGLGCVDRDALDAFRIVLAANMRRNAEMHVMTAYILAQRQPQTWLSRLLQRLKHRP